MRNVLDPSVALKWVLAETDSAKALLLRSEFQAGTRELIAPDVFAAEVANALTRAERKKIIQPPNGKLHLADILSTTPILVPYPPLLARAFDISSQLLHPFYDCLYVALAEREKCEFVTADDKLVKKLQPQFPFIVALSTVS
jgi:predicted nucleic acid-binding protein